MIIRALCDYYHRCGDLAPAGMEYKEIAFLIVIDKDGRFVRIEDRRSEDKKRGTRFLVSKGVGRSSAPVANVLWDNCAYVLGLSEANLPYDDSKMTEKKKEELEKSRAKEREKNIKCNQIFISQIQDLLAAHPTSLELKAILAFYTQEMADILSQIQADISWAEFGKNLTKNISFLIDGDMEIVAEKKELIHRITSKDDNLSIGNNKGLCLITGESSEIAETTTSTSIPGGQATAKLVSFQINSGYDSYGKSKGYNAPISKDAEFRYTTALKRLLDKDSHNKFYIGNRTFIFWASAKSEAAREAEESIFTLFGYTPDDADDPNSRIEQVKKVFNAIYSGNLHTNLDDKFYFLGLAPNAARIAVVYWAESSLREFSGKIVQHFNDMEIVDTRKEKKPYYGLHMMMSTVTQSGKSTDVQPNLPDSVMKSILEATPYPYTLMMACINRIHAEQDLNIYKAAILKAYLNRINDNNKKPKIMMDKENKNIGYLCGRLFATLVYQQDRSSGNDSIRTRYMTSASTTPRTVFSSILSLATHHAEKLDKKTQIYFEQIILEIMSKISADGFPTHLDINDQGRFMVGYYHQRNDFFTKKTDGENENNVEQ